MRALSRRAFVGLFLLPATLLYGVFVVWPVLQSFQYSLYKWRGVSSHRRYVGSDNFRQLFGDANFWRSLAHNVGLLVGCGLAIMLISIAVAHGTQDERPISRLLRSIYLFPQVISLVVVAVLWMFLYNPSFGVLVRLFEALGLQALAFPWLGDQRTALLAVGIAFVWHQCGFYTMLFSAGLKSIPAEVSEAAELDGSVGLVRFRSITWPLLWSTKRTAIIYLVINSMNVFALVFLMTQGGPDRATDVTLTYLYEQAFQNSTFGYATSIAVANFAAVMLLSTLVLVCMRRNPTEARG
mgnify:CR=1 FL=1